MARARPRNLDRHYIAGRWVPAAAEAGSRLIINPANGEASGTLIAGGVAEAELAVGAASRAFGDYSRTPLDERIALLERIARIYERRVDDIAEAITLEMGAPLRSLSRGAQAPAGLAHLKTAIRCLRDYPFERRERGFVLAREPIGVCALITPWNWPMNQILCKAAPALGVGCTVIWKPSEYAPYSAQILAEIVHEAGTPAGVFNLVFGDGPEVGEQLASHPLVDMVSLTGSTRAGASVSRAAAASIKRVSLELGGKSANLLLPDAPLERAVEQGTRRMMSNSGQSCNAPSRLLVPRALMAQVEALAAKTCHELTVGDPCDPNVDLGPLANARQFESVKGMIRDGIAAGARLVTGGPGRPAGLDRGYFVAPTVLSDVTRDMRVAREEIFGPVLVILGFDSVDEAIEIANDSPYGLSAYVYGASKEQARMVAARLRVGMVHLNGAGTDVSAPFGGYKQSGNGREWGVAGLEEFLETKAVMDGGAG